MSDRRESEDVVDAASFVVGLLAGGAVMLAAGGSLADAAFAPAQEFSYWRYAIGGICTGLGVALGNGCTSGHGLCGLSRYSIRSLVATCTFMGMCVVTTLSFAKGLPREIVVFVFSPPEDVGLFIAIGVSALVLIGVIVLVIRYGMVSEIVAGGLCHGSTGLLFAIGLGIGSMTKQAIVMEAFGADGVWNPQLFILFGTALATTFLFYRVGDRIEASHHCPLAVTPGKTHNFSGNNKGPDRRLVTGAALFGVGWGMCGLCPGPFIVDLVTLSLRYCVFGLCMLVAMRVEGQFLQAVPADSYNDISDNLVSHDGGGADSSSTKD
eukprot:CAMPEP_0113298792 /NCGR_PEP_ID=MMETSP0010_2-20120614/1091_1 /TAXON_ID=216773 ORGANISM="Corethron hystrix, Strain 308" /NCGR_SAMPLE_ID=MMETSP0010_2 /ASSEMBLY_ACC=CAM_ASM_000155 /LENGTH=322 /DNA_ID=CAMNT_0000151909 /DNA_START=11 /DNA_END=979 /DNA_ORIENTATION=+ /assembly_acc=CAM_ASM_000155